MGANDAVRTASIARREVRNSIERLEYHLGRGARGTKGVAREVRFLDSLHRQTVRQSAIAVGQNARAAPLASFGQKAKTALQQSASAGNAVSRGRMKSSVLADFSADALQPARGFAKSLPAWKWRANASACPSCLDRHGRVFSGDFVPLHPSCLCTAALPADEGVRPLSDSELVNTQAQYGDPRYRHKLELFKNGALSRAQLAGTEAVNLTESGAAAVAEHAAKGEVVG